MVIAEMGSFREEEAELAQGSQEPLVAQSNPQQARLQQIDLTRIQSNQPPQCFRYLSRAETLNPVSGRWCLTEA